MSYHRPTPRSLRRYGFVKTMAHPNLQDPTRAEGSPALTIQKQMAMILCAGGFVATTPVRGAQNLRQAKMAPNKTSHRPRVQSQANMKIVRMKYFRIGRSLKPRWTNLNRSCQTRTTNCPVGKELAGAGSSQCAPSPRSKWTSLVAKCHMLARPVPAERSLARNMRSQEA